MFIEYEMFARIPGGAAVAVRFDGKGFLVEVGLEGDPDSYEELSYHNSMEHAALVLVDMVKHTSMVDGTLEDIEVWSSDELYNEASYKLAQRCVVVNLR
jgi:hypothetical protein